MLLYVAWSTCLGRHVEYLLQLPCFSIRFEFSGIDAPESFDTNFEFSLLHRFPKWQLAFGLVAYLLCGIVICDEDAVSHSNVMTYASQHRACAATKVSFAVPRDVVLCVCDSMSVYVETQTLFSSFATTCISLLSQSYGHVVYATDSEASQPCSPETR